MHETSTYIDEEEDVGADVLLLDRFGLLGCAGVAVQQPPVALHVTLRQPQLDHLDDHVVRDQFARIHEILGLLSGGSPVLNLVSQQIANRDVHEVVLCTKSKKSSS